MKCVLFILCVIECSSLPHLLQVICWTVAARCCPLQLRLKAAITIVSLCARVCSIDIANKGGSAGIFTPFQTHKPPQFPDEEPLRDKVGIPSTQLVHGQRHACLVCSWCNNFTVCLHMLELCAAQSTGAGAMRAAALGALRQWQQAGGCTTDQVCRCGTAARETVNITVENACDQWWPVTFDWLDA